MKKITLSGDVGWEITASDVRRQLEEANGEDVELVISSRGGFVGEALEIFNLIRNYSRKVVATLAGYAMSAASYIPMAADEIAVEDNAVMMIHNAQGLTWGDHNEMEKYGKILRGLSSVLAKAYAKFTGKEQSEIQAMMDDETWLYGDEIVNSGFATRTIEMPEDDDKDGQTAAAKTAFAGIVARMNENKEAVTADLSRATAMAEASRGIGPKQSNKGEETMDLKELKAKHPDLVEAITNEATAGMDAKLATAREEGASAERSRIQAVHAQSFPGFENIVEEAMFDGKSQAGDVAIQINAANMKAQKAAGEDMSSDAPPPVEEPAHNMAGKLSGKGPMTEEKARAEWDKNPSLAEEFVEFENYWAFVKEDPQFKVKSAKREG